MSKSDKRAGLNFFWPLLFSCWYTLLWAGLTNALLLSIRIRQENAALVHVV